MFDIICYFLTLLVAVMFTKLLQESDSEHALTVIITIVAILIVILNFASLLIEICVTETLTTSYIDIKKIYVVLLWSLLIRSLYELHQWLYGEPYAEFSE